ncbi:helix-turn-helix domain-containing protein [Candidatus Woesebacteria bacterium]|nr:helix-turn-helix domain-containing protein [Candidatus Woesebacteria bacterium]
MPDIEFRNSQKSEEHRYRSTMREVANGWFSEHGFLVVPKLRSDIPAQIQVILPSKCEYCGVGVEKYQRDWEEVGEAFWTELDHYLPEARKLHDKVMVDVGSIGTTSSVYWNEKHYYLRSDRGIGDLAGMMVNYTLFTLRREMGITWTKREALMDFVMTRPVMKKLFSDFEPVYSQLLRVPPKVRRESEEYVRSLGLVLPKQELELRGGKIWVKGQLEQKWFGNKERLILKKLIERRGDVVTYDELADIVWGEGEFKSFWALAKLVERLRGSLVEVGIEPKRIESVRGQGYILNG